MRIARAQIKGFRCIADLVIDFDDLTALVGSGGVGKSTVLNAIDWFFHGGHLAERDRHLGLAAAEPVEEVMVGVTFADLNGADRKVLGAYVQGATTTLTRTYSEEDGEKLSGTAMVFPDFSVVRAAAGANDLKKRYRELFDGRGDELNLPKPATTAEAVKTNMEVWEREHPTLCEAEPSDARHLGGFTGTSLLADRFDYVHVGATAGAPEVLGPGKGSVLDRLLSVLEELDSASREEIEGLQEEAQNEIQEVVKRARGEDLLVIGTGLTKRVSDYFPGAAIRLTDEVAPPRAPQISVRALVSDRGGHPIDPEMQGHGLQRALVIALLHELAESEAPADTEDGAAEPRALMLAIEEPELYQHPLQARALAASLESLSGSATGRPIQVAYSTHSPYFTRPALFADLRLCRRVPDGGSACVAADPEAISTAISTVGYTGNTAESVTKALAENLREAIFARAVLLCEGPTDAAVLEGIADLQGGLDADWVAIAPCGGKAHMMIAVAILAQLEIPALALFDADAAKALDTEAKRNRQLLELCGEVAEDFPAREVRERSANFGDKLESDLAQIWPAYEEARNSLAAELGVDANKKDHRLYREAAARAGEPPEFLAEILEAVRGLA